MIIKSMSRKAPTFGQLIDYIGRNSDPQTGTTFARNLYHSGGNTDVVAGQFLDNYQYLPKRKNGNALYHEVIVLEQQDHLSKTQVETVLHDLADLYCAKRAPHQLAWGRVHWDTKYPHIHLLISSNAVRSDRRVRMEKAQFAQLQKSMETYKEQAFPELKDQRVYQKEEHDRPKVKNAEGELVWRVKAPSAKQQVAEQLRDIFSVSSGQLQLLSNLRAQGFVLYNRGQTTGVLHQATGRRYRLRTLGLEMLFERAIAKNVEAKPLKANTTGKSEHERNSARSETLQTPLPKETTVDPRAAALKANRAQMHAQARDLLDGFERNEENER